MGRFIRVCVCVEFLGQNRTTQKKTTHIGDFYTRSKHYYKIYGTSVPLRVMYANNIFFFKVGDCAMRKKIVSTTNPTTITTCFRCYRRRRRRRRQQPQAQRIRVHIIFSFLFCITFRDIILQHDDMANFRNFTTFPLLVRIYA